MKKILPLVLILGCTTMPGDAPQPATPATAQSQFKNLQVFPPDIQKDELIAAMRVFTRSLGARCNECHVVTATEPKEVLDFPSDAKEEKRVARVMLRMTHELNTTWMNRVEAAEGHAEAPKAMSVQEAVTSGRVSCWTCHRGKTEPELPPPPEERPAG
jgi:predicted trehalose synthase